jgi:hypothetical protein
MSNSGTNVVNADTIGETEEGPKAVGPTLFLKVQIGGVPVEAMVDTGSQSTIISRSLLHKIGRYRKSKGESLPALEKPTARLFGKDGEGGGRELTITAQIEVDIEADGECVHAPVFVQPQSGHECLLGMNVIPVLGLAITRANGEPLVVKQDTDHRVAHVRLVEPVSIPGLKGRFVELVGCGDSNIRIGSPVLFEPKPDVFEILGLSSHESVVTVRDNGCKVVPIQNPVGGSVCMVKGLEIGTVRCVTECYDVKSYGMVNGEEEVRSEYDENGVDGIEGGSQVDEESSRSIDVGATESRSLCECMSAVTQTPERCDELIKSLELPDSQFQQLVGLLDEFSDVFALSDSELGCTDLAKHFIDTDDHQPFKQQPYRTAHVHREKIGHMIDEMKDQGIIQPSVSPWSSPVVLVPKKDGKLRFCVDYRRLNASYYQKGRLSPSED